MNDENNATLKAAQGGVTEAMVERAEAARERYYEVDGNYPEHERDFDATKMAHAAMRTALEAALPAAPCSLNEAMEVIEVWADHGGQVHGEAAARFRALADRIAPEPAAQGEEVIGYITADNLALLKRDDGSAFGHLTAPIYSRARNSREIPLYAAPPAQPADSKVIGDDSQIKPGERAPEVDIKAAVSRFLGWLLPDDFAPDGGISYTPVPRHPDWTHDTRPTGTNLLHAGQAEAMLRYVLATPLSPGRGRGWEGDSGLSRRGHW